MMKRAGWLALFCLSGCGYHLEVPSSSPKTISVPFIKNDKQGELTKALIQNLSKSIYYRLSPLARYVLKVRFIDKRDEHVGFRYDRNSQGELLEAIVPAETRLSVLAEVVLVDPWTSSQVFGPARVSASLVFDHDWYGSREGVNVLSLGQVTDIADAKEAAYSPLMRELARKITDLLEAAAPLD